MIEDTSQTIGAERPPKTNGNGTEDGKGKAGRPAKYCEATVAKLCDAFASGMPQKGACIYAGISETTLADWRKEHEGLSDAITAAREVARHTALRKIKSAGADDWRATEAWLKLVFPTEYRSNAKVEVNANASATAHVHISPERKAELNERRARALARGPFPPGSPGNN